MTIDATRWAEVTARFSELAALPHEVREARLQAIVDADVRAEVRSLLDASASVGNRFEGAPLLADAMASVAADDRQQPAMVGAWRIVRHIGAGGMGTVFEAVREDAGFTKRAALKMIHERSAISQSLVLRFEAERRILARLSHRNIATLLDGGVHGDGRPWFALEYVDGEPLVAWCASRALDIRARVGLVRQACSAVQYAHEHLVVHRDIKPANMLVGHDGTLKLLDFGIARLTDDSEAPLTEAGVSPMTSAYASPEQRAGHTVTTATDIWSLGVVLYQLLTRARPDTDAAAAGTLAPPSKHVASHAHDAGAPDTSGLRAMTQLERSELDAIVMMCLRPDPERRYASAAELGNDLQRWLEGRTVRARPDTLSYRVTMFVRRNRLATAGVVAAIVAMVGGTVVSVQQAGIARAERDHAQREQARTQRVAAFFQTVLTQATPRFGGRTLTVSDALTRAVPIIDTAFVREPDIKAAVQLSVGSTLQNLEQFEQARPLLHAAYDYFRAHDGPIASHDQTDALWDIAALERQDGRFPQAESLYVKLAEVYHQPGHMPNDAVLAGIRIAGIRVDAGDLPRAIAAYDSLLPRLQLRTRDDSLDLAAGLGSRGVALATLGRLDRATTDLARALALDDALLGRDSFATGQLLQPYAGALLFSGKVAAAESIARRALAISRREFGEGAAGTFAGGRMLATVLVSAGRCDEAVAVFSEILTHRGKELPDADPTVGYALAHRGYCRAARGDVDGGIRDAREGLRLSTAALGANHYAVHLAESLAGATLARGGPALRAEALRLLEMGAEGLRGALQPGHLRIVEADARLAAFKMGAAQP